MGEFEITEGRYHLLDIIAKVVSGVFVAAVFAYGICQFKTQNEIESKRIYFDKQIGYLNDLVTVTSDLSVSYPQNVDSLIRKFRSLYHGKMNFFVGGKNFENQALIGSIKKFNDIANSIEAGQAQYNGQITVVEAKKCSDEIGANAKKLIDKLYEVNI